MADNIKKTIDGVDYEITPFMGMHGWRLQMRLGKMIGPVIREALGAFPKGKLAELMNSEVDPAMFGGAVSAFIDAVADNDPSGEMVAELLGQTQRDGVLLSKTVIDKVYAANYSEMFKALIAVIGANNFFGIAGSGFLAGLQKLAAQAPES